MTAAIPTTAVGVFRDRKKAEKAVEDLVRGGFPRDEIHVSLDNDVKAPPPPPVEGDRAAEGGIAGTYLGVLVGGLVGALVLALIPGIAAALAVRVLAGIGLGAIAGGLVGAFGGELIGATLRRRTEPGDSGAGRVIVEVHVGGRYEEAVDILRRHGAWGKGSPLV